MNCFKPMRRWAIALALTALASLTATTRAAPLDDRVPADAIAYVGWAGADALQGQYANSNLKGILAATTLQDFIARQLPPMMDQAAGPADAKAMEMLHKGLMIAWQHPAAFYFRPVDFSNPQQPLPRVGIVVDAGTDSKNLMDLLNDVVASDPPPAAFKVRVAQDGNVVHFSVGSADTPDDLRKGGGIAGSPSYKAAMNNAKHATPALAIYLDAAKGIAAINEALTTFPGTPPEAKTNVPKTIETLGLNSLTQVAYTAGFDGKGWADHLFVGVKGPKTGLLALAGATPLSDAILAMIPKEAVAFSAWKMDLHKLFTEARDVAGKVDPQVQKEFDSVVARAGQEINLNIEKDILTPLGDEWALYRAPSDGGGPSIALVHKLKDGDTFAKTLATVEKMANGELQSSPFKIEKVTTAKTEVSTVALLQYSIAWTVKNGVLYVAPLDSIGGAIKQVENKAPSITENDTYKTARAAFPATAKPFTLSYANPARLYPQLRVLGLGVLPFLRSNGVQVPNTIFPDPDDIAPFLTPGLAMMWSDADGFHGGSKSAFPGAVLVSGQQVGPGAVSVLALGAGIAMPALGRSRQLAGRSVDLASLRGIAVSSVVFASDHNGDLPDDLARLVAEGMVSPKMLVSRAAGTPPLEITPELEKLAKSDFAAYAKNVAEHCDYIYVGGGMKSVTDPSIIVIFEKPTPASTDGMSIAYQDGHAELVRWPDVAEAFVQTNVALKKIGKPEIDIKALFTAASVIMPSDTHGLP